MRKKFVSLLLAICMILPCAFMLNACAQDPNAKYLMFYWENDEAAVMLRDEYRTSDELAGKNFVIPSTYKGEPLRVISPAAFKGSNIGGVVIPNSVKIIHPEAFANCTQLQSVTMSNSVEVIYEGAFKNVALDSIVIPSTLKSLGANAFDADMKLYYNGNATQFAEIKDGEWRKPYEPSENEKWYFYSDNITDLSDYIESEQTIKGLWKYNDNQEIESVAIEYSDTVNGNTYAYTNSEVTLTDEYWQMLLSAKAQGMLEMVLEPAQVTMFNESANKEEFATKLSNLNATLLQDMTVVFADGKFTLWQGETQYSQPLDYVEVSGSVYYNLRGVYTKAYVIENGKIVEDNSTEYGGAKHYYELQA